MLCYSSRNQLEVVAVFRLRMTNSRKYLTRHQTMTTSATMSSTNRPSSYTKLTAIALTTIVTAGTLYSVVYDTALDTSNPLTHHGIRHDGQSSYFAQKHNVFNQYFVKKAWGWSSLAFFGVLLTAPPSISRSRRVSRWIMTTLVWATFAAWFFGPSLFDRLNSLSGAECLVRLPDPPSTGTGNVPNPAETYGLWVPVAPEYCYSRTLITPTSHPTFFTDHPDIMNALSVTTSVAGASVLESLKLRPKLFRGHDISGHLFLLTLSVLFLVDQLTPSVKLLWRSQSASSEAASSEDKARHPLLAYHTYAVSFAAALTALWVLMILTTSVYFHTPFEKVTGFGKI